ncbi:ferredoxin-fold anticodon-binding domain-containing protein 1 [Lissotriton helveticus]
MKLGRHILLVGEGNYSFSAALSDVSSQETCITATGYESEEIITQQALARENVQHLRENGAQVYFQVDCTKLKDYFATAKSRFDQIVFNFPHCGKKTGVRKNREFLEKFFRSCAGVLTDDGEIHVSLCRGQGGTPADHPIREWHNSWQVTAMAARSGFILSSVKPFNPDCYTEYKCTGYRSQEKPFHVEDALIHIFTRSLPLEGSESANGAGKLINREVPFLLPDVLLDRISRNFLDISSHHPVRTFSEQLITAISSAFPLQKVDLPNTTCIESDKFKSALSWSTSVSDSSLFWLSVAKERSICFEHARNEMDRGFPAPAFHYSHFVCEVCDTDDPAFISGQNCSKARLCMRPSLTVCVQDLCQRPDFVPEKIYVLSGPVFRRCLISPRTMPVYHETLFLCGLRNGPGGFSVELFMDTISASIKSVTDSISKETKDNQDEREIHYSPPFISFHQQFKEGDYSIFLESRHSEAGENDGLCVGFITTVPPEQLPCDSLVLLAVLNLDALVIRILGVPDWRMLWTYDGRFISQFPCGKLKLFSSFSMYPPSYVHDISFWVNDEEQFDEVEFHTLVRRVSKECVTDIQLLDRFQHHQTGMISLCYRLIYQSCDKALSDVQASTMQLQIRQELQMLLHVTLR